MSGWLRATVSRRDGFLLPQREGRDRVEPQLCPSEGCYSGPRLEMSPFRALLSGAHLLKLNPSLLRRGHWRCSGVPRMDPALGRAGLSGSPFWSLLALSDFLYSLPA